MRGNDDITNSMRSKLYANALREYPETNYLGPREQNSARLFGCDQNSQIYNSHIC